MATEKAATEESRTTLQSPLTIIITIVIVVALFYAYISGVGEIIVGGAAGAAAGVGVLHSLWEEEERTGFITVVVIGLTGSIAGIVAAMLRSIVGGRSLTGAAIVGAIAGAAIVAIAKPRLLKIIEYLQKKWKVFLVVITGALSICAINTIILVKNLIKWAVSKVKAAAQWIKEAAKNLFNRLASFGASGLAAATAAAVLAGVALASSSGLAGLASGLFGGLLGLGLLFAAGAAMFGSGRRGQSNQQQTQGADLILPIAAFLLFVLLCFLVTSLGLFRCCCLLLFLFIVWFLLYSGSEKH